MDWKRLSRVVGDALGSSKLELKREEEDWWSKGWSP